MSLIVIVNDSKKALMSPFSPDRSGNPFCFFFKNKKIEAKSRKPSNQKCLILMLLKNNRVSAMPIIKTLSKQY
jgi:hypothetical protein